MIDIMVPTLGFDNIFDIDLIYVLCQIYCNQKKAECGIFDAFYKLLSFKPNPTSIIRMLTNKNKS